MKVVIYTCVYNSEQTLPETIESVLRQSYGNFEFYIEDNGSTDGTRAIIYDYAARDSRIVPLIREKNHVMIGEPPPVFMFSPPESDYFTNIDGDDWWEPDYLERLLAFAERFDLDIACTGTLMHEMATGNTGARELAHPLVLSKQQFAEAFPYYHAFLRTIWGKLVRTDLVRQVCIPKEDSLYSYGADTFFSFQLMRHAKRMGVDNSVLHHYRIAPKSISARYNHGRFDTDVYLYTDAIGFLSEFGPISAANRNFLQCVYSNAVIDTVGVIHNSNLSPADKLREYSVIVSHPVTLAVYRECTDKSASRSKAWLIVKTLEAGAALGAKEDKNVGVVLQTLLPRCGQAVTAANAQMFLEDSSLLQGLIRDDSEIIFENLLKRAGKDQGAKAHTIPNTLQALAVNNPLLCQICDEAFLQSYTELYRMVWQERYVETLEQMAGLLLEHKVNRAQETFLQLFISLAALENQPSAFVFGKLELARFYLQQNQLAKCRAAVQELEDMGVEGEGIDALNAELDGK